MLWHRHLFSFVNRVIFFGVCLVLYSARLYLQISDVMRDSSLADIDDDGSCAPEYEKIGKSVIMGQES